MTKCETAIKAIEAWRANPATTFTPANILREFGDDILEGLRASAPETFQARVRPWMLACFGPVIPFDKTERNHRFLEEALELVQSIGCTQSEAHQLVDYVFGREIGETPQEVGGVMVTLAALCIANDLDMNTCGEVELARIWTKVEKIRAKQAAKPKHSPLPEATPSAARTIEPVPTSRVNDELLQACKGAAEWLSGWASADPYLSNLQVAIRNAEATPSTASSVEPVAPRLGGIGVDWWAESVKLYRQNQKLRKALKEQHDWHLAQGEQDFGDGIKLNMADEYGDSAMYERTVAALDTATPPSPGNADAVREDIKKLRADCMSAIAGTLYAEPDYIAGRLDAVLAALSAPVDGAWCELPKPLIGAIVAALGQRVRLMHDNGKDQAREDLNAFIKWADAREVVSRKERVPPQPITDAVTIVAPPIPPLLQREWMAQALFEVDAPDHLEWDDAGIDKRERYLALADTAIAKAAVFTGSPRNEREGGAT